MCHPCWIGTRTTPAWPGPLLALILVAVIGGFLPAWRANRVDPMEALRAE